MCSNEHIITFGKSQRSSNDPPWTAFVLHPTGNQREIRLFGVDKLCSALSIGRCYSSMCYCASKLGAAAGRTASRAGSRSCGLLGGCSATSARCSSARGQPAGAGAPWLRHTRAKCRASRSISWDSIGEIARATLPPHKIACIGRRHASLGSPSGTTAAPTPAHPLWDASGTVTYLSISPSPSESRLGQNVGEVRYVGGAQFLPP